MTTLTQSETLLKELGKMPIFRLSLGSKELFHSNFLEFLWDLDEDDGHIHFIRMINRLLGEKHLKEDGSLDYYLSREKENFDICIYHAERKQTKDKVQERDVYDLIIENKVKSIPSKEQLVKYVERVEQKRKPQAKYLLLSLAESFPDKNQSNDVEVHYEIKDKHGQTRTAGDKVWKVINYDTLGQSIIQQQWKAPGDKATSYIEDYVDFITKLHNLQGAILNTMAGEPLFKEYDLYKQYRLHDLYIKLRCTSFMLSLKNRLKQQQQNLPVYTLPASQVRKQNNKHNDKPGIYLNVNVFYAVGQVGALVWTGEEGSHIYEVIIQGGQYRHGINEYTTTAKRPKENGKKSKEDRLLLDNMWNRLSKNEPSKSFLTEIRGMKDKDIHPTEDKGKAGPYGDYDNGYIYRYILCDQWNVSDLLDNMAKDIIEIAQKRKIIP